MNAVMIDNDRLQHVRATFRAKYSAKYSNAHPARSCALRIATKIAVLHR
jgi:hypothetical protein